MTLSTLWIEKRDQLEGKNVRQIIAFAGNGKLRDDDITSKEFRDFLSQVPSSKLEQYLDECLSERFDDNGFVLQDIVNQIGRRLGFKVTDGRYRGIQGKVGFDGLWRFPDGHVVIIEVKTTDVYQINLDSIANYRRQIILQMDATEENSSILIVIGRDDLNTSSLESQIRGSRYAWNIRIISVDALIRLMRLKETVEDPSIIERISTILIPKEFTKLDEIIDLVFSTAEDVKEETVDEISSEETGIESEGNKASPVSFHDECVRRIEDKIKQSLIKQSKTTYSVVDDSIRISCAISKEYVRSNQAQYWFAFHPFQKQFLENANEAYAAFGCGTEKYLLNIPFSEFSKWLAEMNTTEKSNRTYWHVHINRDGEKFTLIRKKGTPQISLNRYLIA
jgi:hypothetical protein